MEDLQSYNFTVKSSVHDYEVIFGTAGSWLGCAKCGDAIIIDKFIYENAGISGFDGVTIIPIEASEKNKEYNAVSKHIHKLIEAGFRRGNVIYAVGGGVIQDISGFIASMLYRGVEWHFLPTTLLAQGDSCIGGKTSINFGDYKNQLGGFYPPHKIIIDTDYFLRTLPENQITSGLGEMLHYFIIDGERSIKFFEKNYESKDYNALIYKSLEIKKRMVELDEFDRGPRLVFNYGHSFGHVIESITNYGVPHGIAVAHGMDMANFVSWKMGMISRDEYLRLTSVVKNFHGGSDIKEIMIDFYHSNDYFLDKFIELLKKDKKNTSTHLGLILISEEKGVHQHHVLPDEEFKNILREYSFQK